MSRVLKITDPEGMYFVTCTVVQWVDVFTRMEYRKIIVDSLKHCQKEKGLRIHAYVIMSNHIHFLLSRTETGSLLSDILRDFKKYTSKQIIETIKVIPESRREWMLAIFSKAGLHNSNNKNYQFWQQDNHPVSIETMKFLIQKINYIHENPVRAGLVFSAEEYPFSSAVAYAGLRFDSVLPIDILEW